MGPYIVGHEPSTTYDRTIGKQVHPYDPNTSAKAAKENVHTAIIASIITSMHVS